MKFDPSVRAQILIRIAEAAIEKRKRHLTRPVKKESDSSNLTVTGIGC